MNPNCAKIGIAGPAPLRLNGSPALSAPREPASPSPPGGVLSSGLPWRGPPESACILPAGRSPPSRLPAFPPSRLSGRTGEACIMPCPARGESSGIPPPPSTGLVLPKSLPTSDHCTQPFQGVLDMKPLPRLFPAPESSPAPFGAPRGGPLRRAPRRPPSARPAAAPVRCFRSVFPSPPGSRRSSDSPAAGPARCVRLACRPGIRAGGV